LRFATEEEIDRAKAMAGDVKEYPRCPNCHLVFEGNEDKFQMQYDCVTYSNRWYPIEVVSEDDGSAERIDGDPDDDDVYDIHEEFSSIYCRECNKEFSNFEVEED
jgi:hypothetical protein